MTFDWKKLLPYLTAILLFAAIAIFYCAPMLEGKVLVQGDVNNWRGAANEALEYKQATGETTWWTNSMFSGMPTYQITGSMPTNVLRKEMISVIQLGQADNVPYGLIFAYFVGFFLMLLCFGVNPWLSLAGALALGFSSYFFLIIPAGHITKASAISCLAPMIGGFYAIFRKRYCLGAPIFILYGFLGLNLHPQMTFYICMLMGVLACAELYIHIRDKAWKNLGVSLAVLLGCALLVFATKMSWMQMNQSYLKETMRGGHSELTTVDSKAAPAKGLDLDYATAWSYGKGETMTLLIPNWEGGASGFNVGSDSKLCQTMREQGIPRKSAEQFCQQAPTYRGEKAFTSGPVYVGAIVCFLFVLALIIVPGPYKWALLIATLFSVFLSWGRNMMWLTELFFNWFPMYNKFRAVESILVVAEITMPLLAFLGLQRIVEHRLEWKQLRTALFIAGGITGGLCLMAALFASTIDVTSSYDAQWTQQVPAWLKDAIYEQRTAMIRTDAWRSLLFVALGWALVFFYAWRTKDADNKRYSYILYAGMIVLVIADMLPVDKRFFSNEMFISQKEQKRQFAIQPYEEAILSDKTLDFRTLNLATNTFNDARTSYRLKSIGGYSAVKLRRYQDLIDTHISAEMQPLMQAVMRTNGFAIPDEQKGADFPVLNMLNMRYVVVPLQGGQMAPVQNPYAMGNAWFVENIVWVDSPNDECAKLSQLDLHREAVVDKRFEDKLNAPSSVSGSGEIELLSYQPNELVYRAQTEQDRVAVFSEVYYPEGWHLYIDGEEAPIARANYILRAALIPAGTHQIKMTFTPEALATDRWSMAAVILALCICCLLIVYSIWPFKVRK